MNLNTIEKTDEMRRLALQIAIQLPERVDDARRVLAMAGECLDDFLIDRDAPRSPHQRARRLGWHLDLASAAPPAAADDGSPPLELAPMLAWSAATLLITVPLAALLSRSLGYGWGFPYGFAVVAIAVLFGRVPAVLLACLSPIIHNFLVLGPPLEFSWPSGYEATCAAGYLALAVAVPALMRRQDCARRLVARSAQRFTWLFSAARSGSGSAAKCS